MANQSTLNDSLDQAENVDSEYSLVKSFLQNLPTFPSTVLYLPALLPTLQKHVFKLKDEVVWIK